MELVIKPSAAIGDRLNIGIISFQKGLLKNNYRWSIWNMWFQMYPYKREVPGM
jgi:hypothetical protein